MAKPIKGFSKLSKEEKIEWLTQQYFRSPEEAQALLRSYWHRDEARQKLHDEFIENTLSNYFLPFGIAPNFLIDGELYAIPMAIEESSVVAAAAKSAQFWLERGGFQTTVIDTVKIGHVHFIYRGEGEALRALFREQKARFFRESETITANMQARGGGIIDLALVDKKGEIPGYYQLEARFETCDSMGANFINSCLEQFAHTLKSILAEADHLDAEAREVEIVMCILSNYTPECLVRSEVRCPIKNLDQESGMRPEDFAQRFARAVQIAEIEPYRATTHNKGIMNGVDAVVIATGNDFRAVESACHTYASRSGQYRSLTHCAIEDGEFRFWIELPLALGTVGGLTRLHPLVKFSLDLLQGPSARNLMRIVASSGLAQNFAALRALVTTGIQQGHMKMHLLNILNQLEATDAEKNAVVDHFRHNVVSHAAAVRKLCELRGISTPDQWESTAKK